MFKLPKKKRAFALRFDETTDTNAEAENKNDATDVHFEVPDNAEYKLVNTVPHYIVTLVDGEMPTDDKKRDAELASVEKSEKSTKRAVLFCHKKIEPMKVPASDWVLHDGSSLTQGTAKAVLLYRETAELMNNWDIVYKISPHPRKPGEIAVREIYLCPVGTADTQTNARNAPECINCGAPATSPCRCHTVFYCHNVCRNAAQRNGVHDDDACLEAYTGRLVAQAARERQQAIEAAKRKTAASATDSAATAVVDSEEE